MKLVAILLVLFSVNSFANDIPERLEGRIHSVFCGDLYKSEAKRLDTCILGVKTEAGKEYEVFASENGYLSTVLIPEGEANEIVIGRLISLRSCEAPRRELSEAIEALELKGRYIQCYSSFAELKIEAKDALRAEDIAGEYMGKSKVSGKSVRVSVRVEEDDDGDLFNAPTFKFEILYNDDISVAYMKSGDLYLAKKDKGSYFYGYYFGACDDPDCFNTDGRLQFIRNANGNYTLMLEFDHYNAHPQELDEDEDKFSELVFLKRD